MTSSDSSAARSRALVFSWTGAALVLAILVVSNFLASFVSARLDFSSGRIYSVSKGTKQILGRIKDNLIIKAYFSGHLPAQYAFQERYIRDLLGEYKAYGGSHVKVEFLNPDSNPRVRTEAISGGIQPFQINIMAQDKFEAKEAFMGILFLYNGKSAVLPMVHDVNTIEYAMTSRIRRLVALKKHVAGFVTGHGEKEPDDPQTSQVFQAIGEDMDVRSVSLEKPLPKEIEALWILGPIAKFKAVEIERLKSWVGSGRSLGILFSRKQADLKIFRAVPVSPGLEPLLESWGLHERQGYVVDAQCERIQTTQQYGLFMAMQLADYPYLPVVTDLNRENAATRSLSAVIFPFVEPIVFNSTGNLSYVSLANSSKLSWYQTSPTVSPSIPLEKLMSPVKGPFSLAGIASGDFYKITPSTQAAVEGEPLKQAPGRVILVGTSAQLDPSFISKSADIAFLMNLLEWSFQDEVLLSIRAKGIRFHGLRQLSPAARTWAKFAMIIFLPAALLFVATAVYQRQRRRRSRLPLLYGEASPS